MRCFSSGPWQAKQLSERMGRISRSKSTGAAVVVRTTSNAANQRQLLFTVCYCNAVACALRERADDRGSESLGGGSQGGSGEITKSYSDGVARTDEHAPG